MQLSYGALGAFLAATTTTEKRVEFESVRKTMDQAMPLIVCGMGRSGTRMCANILSNSSDIELQGEVGGPAGSRMMNWLEAVHAQSPDDDPHRIYRLARVTFREGSAGRPQDRPRARWFGYKSPRHERYFERYEALFSDPKRPARYVYCLRNPFHVWRSYRAMPWNKFKDVRAFLEAWVRSARTYEAMVEAAPGRVILFNLDDMVRSDDRLKWLTPVLLEPLGISPESFRRPVEALANSNSALNKLGKTPDEPPAADMAAIAADRDVIRIVQAYFPWMEDELARHRGPAPRARLLRFFRS